MLTGLKLHGTHIAEGLVNPLAVIKDLNKLKDRALHLFPSAEVAIMDQLVFQRTKEALRHGIVVAIAAATHAGNQPMLRQHVAIGRRRIRGPLVRVMDQARVRATRVSAIVKAVCVSV